tara:strand:- start:965 stop:1546 length:582 start_codon:yes stop_codon:yes gene_type:complete
MLEHLFGSKTRYKLLKTFFHEPDTALFVRELVRAIDAQINAVRRELELLCNMGLIECVPGDGKQKGPRKKYYKANTQSLLFSELQALLQKEKVLGKQEFVETLQHKLGDIDLFILSGCFTGDTRSPTDILLVGDVGEKVVEKIILDFEQQFDTPIRYTIMSGSEFKDRRQVMDKFLFAIFEAKHIKVENKPGK